MSQTGPPTKHAKRAVAYRTRQHGATGARREATRTKLDELTRHCPDCGETSPTPRPIVHIPGCSWSWS